MSDEVGTFSATKVAGGKLAGGKLGGLKTKFKIDFFLRQNDFANRIVLHLVDLSVIFDKFWKIFFIFFRWQTRRSQEGGNS